MQSKHGTIDNKARFEVPRNVGQEVRNNNNRTRPRRGVPSELARLGRPLLQRGVSPGGGHGGDGGGAPFGEVSFKRKSLLRGV